MYLLKLLCSTSYTAPHGCIKFSSYQRYFKQDTFINKLSCKQLELFLTIIMVNQFKAIHIYLIVLLKQRYKFMDKLQSNNSGK